MRSAIISTVYGGTNEINATSSGGRPTGSDTSPGRLSRRPQLSEEVAGAVRHPDHDRRPAAGDFIRLDETAAELG